MASGEQYYVRIWNSSGKRVFGWLGTEDGYATCVPAGVYSNPRKVVGALPVRWNAGLVELVNSDDPEVAVLAGADSGGQSAHWRPEGQGYSFKLEDDPNVKLVSPVAGELKGNMVRFNGGASFYLYLRWEAHKSVLPLWYLHDVPGPELLFAENEEVKLQFTPEKLILEFVRITDFDPHKSSYAPPVDPELPHAKSWMSEMKDIIQKRPLTELVIPGSHDAASWNVLPDIFGQDTNERSRTQVGNIYDQLLAGSRYLDLRFAGTESASNPVWRGNHGLDLTSALLPQVLDDIVRFLNESTEEILLISILPTRRWAAAYLDPDVNPGLMWDLVLNRLGDRVFPRVFTDTGRDGSGVEYFHFLENLSIEAMLKAKKNVLLFSWGKPPVSEVSQGPMQGKRRDYYIWPATPGAATLTVGSRPWEAAFQAAQEQGYSIDFDSLGVWINSYETTANDLRMAIDTVQPPVVKGHKKLWLMHVNAPASPAQTYSESILDKARRIQPAFRKWVEEDPSMTSKLNVVNLDFIQDPALSVAAALYRLNLSR